MDEINLVSPPRYILPLLTDTYTELARQAPGFLNLKTPPQATHSLHFTLLPEALRFHTQQRGQPLKSRRPSLSTV